MVKLKTSPDKVPVELSFVEEGQVFVKRLSAEAIRQIEKGFPHYTAAAGPSKAGRIQEDKQAEYEDEVVSQAVVDEDGKRVWASRAAVAALDVQFSVEVTNKVFAAFNGSGPDAEL